MNPQLTWNLITDVQQMWAYPFMVTALRAGTVVAVLAGVVGWVMVLRKESFAGHTLAIVGFPGAAAAAWLGVATGYGYFAACIGAAISCQSSPVRAGNICASNPPVRRSAFSMNSNGSSLSRTTRRTSSASDEAR